MKFIVAVVKPSKLDSVREALTEIGIEGMTASEVKGYGRQKGHKEIYRGSEYTINFVPKMKVEVAVADEMAERAMQAIQDAARTGEIGDGKIFVLPMEAAARIRTGETGNDAL